VRDDVESLIALLAKHQRRHSEEHYYAVRDRDPRRLEPAESAARLIYLNRTCFNGLYRVNRHGRFNVPMGSYDNPKILDAANLRAASAALRGVRLKVADFRDMLAVARKGDFIYFDPPYQPLSPTSSFTSYAVRDGRAGFDEDDQRELAEAYARLARRGCRVMLSNSDTPLVRRLYRRFRICGLDARRNINSKSDRRGAIREVVVLNYEPPGTSWADLLIQV
jgi:DNA adenine methylase